MEACKNASEDQSVSGVVETVTSRLMDLEGGFLLNVFGLVKPATPN